MSSDFSGSNEPSSDSSSNSEDDHSSHNSLKVVLTALIINITIGVVKGIAAFLSGSASMFSETIHSFVDCGNQIFLLLGVKLSRKDASKMHPLGHSREIFLWSFVVSISLFLFGGVSAISEGISKIRHPEAFHDIHMFGFSFPAWYMNMTILVISAILEGNGFKVAWKSMMSGQSGKKVSALKVFRNSTDPNIFICVMEDGIALLGLTIAGTATIMAEVLNMPIMDGVASLIIGIMLLCVSFLIGNESKSLLIGESNKRVEDYARSVVAETSGITGLNEIISEQRGPNQVIVLLSIDWDNHITAGQVEEHVSEIERKIRKRFKEVSRVFIEAQSNKRHKEFELISESA